MNFEFVMANLDPRTNLLAKIERQSDNFAAEYNDTINNYSKGYFLITPSGSAAENLATDETLIVVGIDYKSFAFQSLRLRILTAVLFIIIIVTAFYLTVRTMLRQKKLGDIKNDFINNMTHEFKTPIATISLAVDAMKNEKVLQDREKIGYFSGIIKEENQRMNRQVETILKASQLEKQEVDLNLKPVHVHEIIKNVADNFGLQLEEKKGRAELLLNAENDLINADEVHFSNLINNLIDNAVKYSVKGVQISVEVAALDVKKVAVRIEDKGVGIPAAQLKRIFKRFYRVPGRVMARVKGTGLGLFIVSSVVKRHGGRVFAESEGPGKGSQFTIQLPRV